jgi:predicted metalloprotease with PDZ domain
MKRICAILIGTVLFSTQLFAEKINYNLHMIKPQNHYFQVEMVLSDFKEATLEIKMPVWAPGSYLVREFAKNVDLVKAKDENGKSLIVKKTSKNTWEIQRGKTKEIHVNYEVYAFELSVRTSFLDLTHGFVSASGVFMYVNNHKSVSGELSVYPHSNFQTITTALPGKSTDKNSEGKQVFEFSDYDQLVDCPIEIGNQEVFQFTAAGVPHTVAIYGVGNYTIERLKTDMAKIVETATAVIGENPNNSYTFIIHNVVDGQGGLEHTNSCTLSVNRWTYEGSGYTDFLSLVAHEYFHLWNVKRIRPIELGPFNYDEENYTSLLWVMEGFTSYYDELLLCRAGYLTQEEFLNKLQSSINYVEGSVGARVQPVAHASFDAWIKAYRPTENSANTTMTYYSRGSMLAALLDAKIIAKYNGTKGLDHFLRQLYSKYYKKLNRGFSEDEFKQELKAFLGEDMDDFFEKYVNGTEIVPLSAILGSIGVNVENVGTAKPSFGASLKQDGGKVIVRAIRSGSAAETAGLSVNDEVIACNGFRVDQQAFETFVTTLDSGTELNLLIARDEILYELKAVISMYNKPQFKFGFSSDSQKNALRNYWLRKQ